MGGLWGGWIDGKRELLGQLKSRMRVRSMENVFFLVQVPEELYGNKGYRISEPICILDYEATSLAMKLYIDSCDEDA